MNALGLIENAMKPTPEDLQYISDQIFGTDTRSKELESDINKQKDPVIPSQQIVPDEGEPYFIIHNDYKVVANNRLAHGGFECYNLEDLFEFAEDHLDKDKAAFFIGPNSVNLVHNTYYNRGHSFYDFKLSPDFDQFYNEGNAKMGSSVVRLARVAGKYLTKLDGFSATVEARGDFAGHLANHLGAPTEHELKPLSWTYFGEVFEGFDKVEVHFRLQVLIEQNKAPKAQLHWQEEAIQRKAIHESIVIHIKELNQDDSWRIYQGALL